ncbi:hypothetical protein Lsan_2091 [Legionella santicrucis]|uniref:SidC N-terminal domain-containing protein n=2 Tax=Legionella santicrucis TaxID=45074 RepID=A0A0W0YTX2_9GAMM|nr:hypothetical protein Lsan_2091 [Legionella santicrucis]
MPVVSGTDIGLDNTCKAVSSLQEFFGKGNDSKTTLKGALLAYQEALKQDLSLLGADSVLAQQKQERLTQIEAYLNVVKHLEHHEELECLNKGFPSYPRPLEGMLQDKSGSNLHSIILRPTRQDAYIRSEASIPLFSVAHDSEACQRWDTQSLLQKTLIDTYSGLRLQAQNVTSQLMERVLVRLDQVGQSDFDDLQKILQEETLALTGIPINFNQDAQGKPLNQERIKQEIFLVIQ